MANTPDSDPSTTLPQQLQCAKCATLKPRAEFKRILSRAQAKQVGYSGDRRVQITSTLCKACRPKRKPAAKLNKKELLNRINNGDIHPLVGQQMLTERQQKGRFKMASAIDRAWDKARAQTWAVPTTEIRNEIRTAQSACNYRHRAGPASLFQFLVCYLVSLQRIKTRMLHLTQADGPTKHTVAPFTDWQDYAEQDVVEYVKTCWDCVPENDRLKLRHPPSLINFAPDQRRAPPARPQRPAKKGDATPATQTETNETKSTR